MTKFESVYEDFTRALTRLEKILKEPKNDIVRDSAIKRFEMVFDLSWKTVKAWLEERGVTCSSPRACFEEAYRQKLIAYDARWIAMISDRNYVVHAYKETFAEKIYAGLPEKLSLFQELAQALRNG